MIFCFENILNLCLKSLPSPITIPGMNAIEKIKKFMASRGMNAAQFSTLSSIHKSGLSELFAGKKSVSSFVAQRAASAMGISVADLLNESLDWPLPERVDPGRLLLKAEAMVLDIAREVSGDDPELREAKRRLLLIGYAKASPELPPDQSSP